MIGCSVLDVGCWMFPFIPRMSITYLEAIREAQAHALRDDPRVFIYGQDVGAFGGAFKGHEKSGEGISRPRD